MTGPPSIASRSPRLQRTFRRQRGSEYVPMRPVIIGKSR